MTTDQPMLPGDFRATCALPAAPLPAIHFAVWQAKVREKPLPEGTPNCKFATHDPYDYVDHMTRVHNRRPAPSRRPLRLSPPRIKPDEAALAALETSSRYSWTTVGVARSGQLWGEASPSSVWVVPDDEPGTLVRLEQDRYARSRGKVEWREAGAWKPRSAPAEAVNG